MLLVQKSEQSVDGSGCPETKRAFNSMEEDDDDDGGEARYASL